MKQFSKQDVLDAANGVSTISEIARRMGLCRNKIDGRTIKAIHSAFPGLNRLLKSNKAKGASTESPAPSLEKVSPNNPPHDSENPYRPGSTYEAIFHEGSKDLITKEDLIAKVASITGKSEKCISFSLSVLCHKSHSSNGGRSTALIEEGKIKLIALRRKHRG